MKANAPTTLIWIIALVAGILGIVAHFVNIPFVTQHQFWFVAGGFILLALGTTFKGI